ncbi:MAG: arylesterase [Novosphingobium sp.]
MKLYGFCLCAALALAGCGASDAPKAPASQAASAEPTLEAPVIGEEQRIFALGDSLFAGYGLEQGESYPAMLERALRARGINARMVNAGVSGDTSAGGQARLAFALDAQERPPVLALVCLGGNDMLRGLPPEQTRANLDAILAELKRRKIPVVLMGMLAPPNLGADYRAKFDPIYPSLARKYGAVLVPFFLQPVIGKDHLIQQDHIHPNKTGIEQIVAATVGDVAKVLPSPAAPPPRR